MGSRSRDPARARFARGVQPDGRDPIPDRARARRLLGAGLCIVGAACATASPDAVFLRAIQDAAVPEPREVRSDLVAITDANPLLRWRDPARRRELLAASLVSEEVFQRYYGPAGRTGTTPTPGPLVWVTLVPQLRDACRSWKLAGAELEMRTKQYLGLRPGASYARVLLLWIDRERLFRPCADPETADTQCSLDSPQPPSQVAGVDDYRRVFLDLFESSYRADGAPWTRLGYTYDWNPASGSYGASEFVVAPGTPWEVHGAPSLDEYCAR